MNNFDNQEFIKKILESKDFSKNNEIYELYLIKNKENNEIYLVKDKEYFSKKLEYLNLFKDEIIEYSLNNNLEKYDLFEKIWVFYLPFSLNLLENKNKNGNKPFIQGILGVQGSGKTTCSEIIAIILNKLGYKTVSFSIDDIYKTYEERKKIKEEDPRFKWRGPPGTHDIQIAYDLLNKIKNQEKGPFLFPIFDKAKFSGEGDRVAFKEINKVDIVIFEGWFLGYRPLNLYYNDNFTRDINKKLEEYIGLWDLIDNIIALIPEDLNLSKVWRLQAEKKLRNENNKGLSDLEIEEFVEYFWRALPPQLHIENIIENKLVDDVFYIDSKHKIIKLINLKKKIYIFFKIIILVGDETCFHNNFIIIFGYHFLNTAFYFILVDILEKSIFFLNDFFKFF